MESIEIVKLFLSISAKIGFAPANFTAEAVATNVTLGIMTSSFGLIPAPSNDRKIATVPLVVAIAYFVPKNFLKFS